MEEKELSREEKIKKIIELAKKRRAEFSAWEKAYLEGGGSRNDDLYLEKYNIWEGLGHLVSIFRRELDPNEPHYHNIDALYAKLFM